MFEDHTISFIGGGNMAEAMIKGILNRELIDPQRVIASDPRVERGEELTEAYGICFTTDNSEAADFGEIVVLS
ncbi:MAG: NAD(P)-binding domain-containing protein, partial [Desulfocapsaceae bacterium]